MRYNGIMVATTATLFGRDEVAALRRRSRGHAIGMVAHAWATIGAAMAVFALWPNPLTLIAAVMVIGARQLGLAILMHDTAHGLLWSDPKWNDRLGQWLCAFPVFADVRPYRHYHLKHPRFTQQAEDPDLVLSAPFPITKASFRRKMLRDLTGRTAFQQRRSQVAAALGPRDWPWRKRLGNFQDKLGGPLFANAVLCAGLAAAGYWYLYPLLWLLPLVTWYQVAVRVRNIAEHAMVPDNNDPLRNTRTTQAGPLARLLLAPYFVNYHLEHHLLTAVPCYRLPAMHRLLAAKGVMENCEVQPDYGAVLRLATTRQAEPAARAPRTHGRTFHG
jgi:fatty acid desaturase